MLAFLANTIHCRRMARELFDVLSTFVYMKEDASIRKAVLQGFISILYSLPETILLDEFKENEIPNLIQLLSGK
jgi:hypothetical protein